MLTIDDISKIFYVFRLWGVIPECPSVLQASNEGKPVILYDGTKAGQTYDDLVARFPRRRSSLSTHCSTAKRLVS